MGLGGYICRESSIPGIEERWANVKQVMGLSATDELKWNLPTDHPSRIALRGGKWDRQVERAPAMVNAIADMEVTVLCDVMVDTRKRVQRPPEDFYRYALEWLLLKFANVLVENGARSGPHLVVADYPPSVQNTQDVDLKDDPAYAWLPRRDRIAFDVYTDAYTSGFSRYPTPRPPCLRDLGLYPSLLTSHADVNPCLQIADVVVGATTQCVKENLTQFDVIIAKPSGFRPLFPQIVMQQVRGDTCMPTLWRKFLGFEGGKVIRTGFCIFPSERVEGWPELRDKMQGWYPEQVGWF